MAILTKSGRVVIAESIASRPVHIAWGTGDGSWTTPPGESIIATNLLNEVGRRLATVVGFVVPDVNGAIVMPNGTKFTLSGTPTSNLYVTAEFDFVDASSSVIREAAIMVGTEIVAGLPAGQKYFTPDQVTNPGRLLQIEYFEPIFRSPAVRETYQAVIEF